MGKFGAIGLAIGGLEGMAIGQVLDSNREQGEEEEEKSENKQEDKEKKDNDLL